MNDMPNDMTEQGNGGVELYEYHENTEHKWRVCKGCKLMIIQPGNHAKGCIVPAVESALSAAQGECERQAVSYKLLVKELEKLTPLGSEFVDRPLVCLKWVRDRIDSLHRLSIDTVKEKQDAQQRIAELERELAEANCMIAECQMILFNVPELNMNNYDFEQVRALNNGMIEVYQVLHPAEPQEATNGD